MNLFICLLLVITVVCDEYDDNFLACCKEKGLSPKCQKMCNYHIDAELIIRALFDNNCGVNEGPAYYQCLHNMKDNRECCERNSVGDFFEFCLDMCDGTTPILHEMKYFNCKEYGAIAECGQHPWV